jgi:hypothetical protein
LPSSAEFPSARNRRARLGAFGSTARQLAERRGQYSRDRLRS